MRKTSKAVPKMQQRRSGKREAEEKRENRNYKGNENMRAQQIERTLRVRKKDQRGLREVRERSAREVQRDQKKGPRPTFALEVWEQHEKEKIWDNRKIKTE